MVKTVAAKGMKVTVDDKGTKFVFSADAKTLDACINKVKQVIEPGGTASKESYVITSNGSELLIVGCSADTLVVCAVPDSTVKGIGSFSFDPIIFTGVIKGRSKLDFEFTGTECVYKLTKGAYNGKLVTIPISSDTVMQITQMLTKKETSVASIPFDDTVMKFLDEALLVTGVKDIYANNSILTYIVLSDKGMTVFSFDQHHFAHYKTAKVKIGTAQVAASSALFSLISKMFAGDKAKLTLRKENLRIESESVLMIVPTVQANDNDFTLVPDYIKSIKTYDYQCEYDSSKMLNLVDNLIPLHSANSLLEFAGKPGASTLSLSFHSQNGSAADSLKVTNSAGGAKGIKVKVDPRLVKDTFALMKGNDLNPTLGVVGNKMMVSSAKLKTGAVLTLVNSITG